MPGKILAIEGDDPVLRSGKVDFAGIQKRVNLSYVPEARVGDYVLVHVGFAISTVDEEEAAKVFDYLREMGDLAEELGADAAPRAESRAPRAESREPQAESREPRAKSREPKADP